MQRECRMSHYGSLLRLIVGALFRGPWLSMLEMPYPLANCLQLRCAKLARLSAPPLLTYDRCTRRDTPNNRRGIRKPTVITLKASRRVVSAISMKPTRGFSNDVRRRYPRLLCACVSALKAGQASDVDIAISGSVCRSAYMIPRGSVFSPAPPHRRVRTISQKFDLDTRLR
jgi:hypothetical protein